LTALLIGIGGKPNENDTKRLIEAMALKGRNAQAAQVVSAEYVGDAETNDHQN